MAHKKSRRSRFDTEQGRFDYMLETLFDGNQSRMADALKCSQAVISQIHNGQKPGRAVLSRLADFPRVNRKWLYYGEGEPLLAESESGPLGGHQIPIFRELLEGAPAVESAPLTGQTYPVVSTHYAATRYFVEVQHGTPITRSSQGIRPGDLLLIDADPKRAWSLDDVNDRLCVVRTKQRATNVALAHVSYIPATKEAPEELNADYFSRLADKADKVERQILVHIPPSGPARLIERHVEVMPGGSKRPMSQLEFLPESKSIQLNQIVGVCVQLVRRMF